MISSSPTSLGPTVTARSANTASPNHKNVATFAGAIGGSLGVLCIVAASLAFSIYRRRLLAARREDRGHSSDPNNTISDSGTTNPSDAENGPHMREASASSVFVPRYFPGTVLPTALSPPSYDTAISNYNAPMITSDMVANANAERVDYRQHQMPLPTSKEEENTEQEPKSLLPPGITFDHLSPSSLTERCPRCSTLQEGSIQDESCSNVGHTHPP